MSTILIVVVAALVVLALLVTFALASAAKRADRQDGDVGMLGALARLRSPSGKPFFGNRDSVSDFVETLDRAQDEVDRKE